MVGGEMWEVRRDSREMNFACYWVLEMDDWVRMVFVLLSSVACNAGCTPCL
jgi:hypothetical protein